MPVRLLASLLPAVIPSWRFFDQIGPAPHIEWSVAPRLTPGPAEEDIERWSPWQPVDSPPAHVTMLIAFARLFWNPRRNESLFIASCAERLLDDPTPARADLLWTRVADIVRRTRSSGGPAETVARALRVRIVEVTRDGDRLARDVVYCSPARPL